MLLLIEADSTDVHVNQATEEFLLRNLADGDTVLFLWQNARCVVCGHNQSIEDECREAALVAAGGKVARRISGGGAVYHDLGNLNFSFIATAKGYSLKKQLEVIRRAVASFGLDAEKSGRNDLTVDGRKFSGNAFAKVGANRLHHGTIMVSLNVEDAAKFLTPSKKKLAKHAVSSVASRIVNLGELSPAITLSALKGALADAFAAVYGEDVTRRKVSPAERMGRQEYYKRFSDPAWLHRKLGVKPNDEL